MKFAQHFSGQRIIRQILDWLQLSKSDSISERQADSWSNGVLQSRFNNMAIVGKDLDPLLLDFFHIKIDTGVANFNGERILIDDATITYNAANPAHTTDDGLGNFLSTPYSTGSFDIPVTSGSMNYVWIAYLQTTDDSVFTLHKLTNAKQYYKRTDGYEIQVTTVNVNPDTARYIFLGSVDCTGINQAITSNISIVNRDLARTRLNRVAVETNNSLRTDRPASYTDNQSTVFVDDHVKAVGSGPVTPFNPHGVTLLDMGISTNQTVEAHRQIEHANGIVAGNPGSPSPTASALNVVRVVVTPGDDYVLIKALALGEYALINGTAFDSTNIPADVTILFTGDAAGTYNIYYDSVTETFAKTTASIAADNTKLWLATTTWDPTIPTDGNLSIPLDRRRFGALNLLQRWGTVARPANPMPGTFGYNLDNSKLEYFNGLTWVQLP